MFHRLPDYLEWSNSRTLLSLEAIPSELTEATKKFSHIVAAEETWLARLTGRPAALEVWPKESSLALAKSWITLNAEGYRKFLSPSTGSLQLDRTIHYTASTGGEFTSIVSDVLMHVISHGNYHRGQIASMVKASGGAPAVTDYIFFTRMNG